MKVSHIKIYRDEVESDDTWGQYCQLDHAQHCNEGNGQEYLIFYTVSINDVPFI